MTLHNIAAGSLTLTTHDGYVLTAPVEGFTVRTDDHYSDVGINSVFSYENFFHAPQEVIFEARLAQGQQYTIEDKGTEITRTLAFKGVWDVPKRSALGIPKDADGSYDIDTDTSTYTWTERVLLDG